MADRWTRVGDALGKRLEGRIDRRDPLYVERVLADLPPTDRLEGALAGAAARLADLRASYPPDAEDQPYPPHEFVQAKDDIARIRAALDKAATRDAIAAERPPGCWCLGLGGKGRTVLTDITPEDVVRDPQTGSVSHTAGGVLLDPDGRPVESWAAYCPCADGQALRAEHAAVRERLTRTNTQARLDRLWVDVPEQLRGLTLDGLAGFTREHAALVRRLRAWMATDHWLWLYGLPGVGKTGALYGLCNAFRDAGVPVLPVNVVDMLLKIKSTYRDNKHAADEDDVMASLRNAVVLGLDDLGREADTPWVGERIYLVLNGRYNAGRRTIITSNEDPDQMADLIGHNGVQTVERITQMTGPAWTIDVSSLPHLRAILAERNGRPRPAAGTPENAF